MGALGVAVRLACGAAAAGAARVRAAALLHLSLLLLLHTAVAWAWAAVAALVCRLHVQRRSMGPWVLLYKNVVGGYHPNCDVHDYWEELEETVQQAAPAVRWGRLPTFRLCYDDQFGKPFGETCRSSIGWVVSSGCVDPAAEAAAWRRHPLVAQHGLRVGIFPRCACFATELPHCGPMSHGVALARVLPLFMDLAREGRVRCVQPGVLQLCDPLRRRISFVCPQEARQDMLPPATSHLG